MNSGRRLTLVAWATLCVPLVWWTGQLIARGWIPHGDRGIVAVRVHDVFSRHTPLLGMPSTAQVRLDGIDASHPGALQFYLLAPLYHLTGEAPWSLLVGSALIIAGLFAVAIFAAYDAAKWAGAAAVVVSAGMLELVTQTSLVTPWNPWPAAAGVLAAVGASWAILCDHQRWWPAFVVAASLAAQSHLAVAPVMVVGGAVTLVAVGLRWRAGNLQPAPVPWAVAGALLAGCWVSPVVDQFTREPGNLTQLLKIAGSASLVGPAIALAAVLVVVLVVRRLSRTGVTLTSGRPDSIIALSVIGVGVVVWSALRVGWESSWYVPLAYSIVAVPVLSFWFAKRAARWRPPVWKLALVTVALVIVTGLTGVVGGGADYVTISRQAVASARSLVADVPLSEPIQIRTTGRLAWSDSGAAVYAAFLADGRNVWYGDDLSLGREDDFRHPANLTGERVVLTLESTVEKPATTGGDVIDIAQLDAGLPFGEPWLKVSIETSGGNPDD